MPVAANAASLFSSIPSTGTLVSSGSISILMSELAPKIDDLLAIALRR
jgi:hypothetical protein